MIDMIRQLESLAANCAFVVASSVVHCSLGQLQATCVCITKPSHPVNMSHGSAI